MADMPLYEGDTVILRWGTLRWECQVYRHDELCGKCGGATVRIDPPWETWRFLCCAESALTVTRAEHQAAIDNLAPGAIGMVSSIPVRVAKKGTETMAEIPPPDNNDQALVQYFLRGMRRFEKHVRAQDISQTADDTVAARIAAAYQLARSQFQSMQENQS